MGLHERAFHSARGRGERKKQEIIGEYKEKNWSKKKKNPICWKRNLWNRRGGGTVHEEISALLTKRSLFSLCQTAGQDPGRSLYKQKRHFQKKNAKKDGCTVRMDLS